MRPFAKYDKNYDNSKIPSTQNDAYSLYDTMTNAAEAHKNAMTELSIAQANYDEANEKLTQSEEAFHELEQQIISAKNNGDVELYEDLKNQKAENFPIDERIEIAHQQHMANEALNEATEVASQTNTDWHDSRDEYNNVYPDANHEMPTNHNHVVQHYISPATRPIENNPLIT